jgi:DNA polymerase III delta prime subunit
MLKHIVLLGEGGIGKTTTAKKLISELNPKILIEGIAYKNSTSYELFYNMLDSFFEIDIFNKRNKNEFVDKALVLAGNVLLGSVANFMCGNNEDSISKEDLFYAVKSKFLEFKEGIIFIDDIQWIDNASKELLKYLLKELKETNFYLIVTSRERQIVEELGLNNIFELNKLDKTVQKEFLQKNYSLSDEVSDWIIKWINQEYTTPSELVEVVNNLYMQNFLKKSDKGFVFSDNFDKKAPKIPQNIKEKILQIFEKYPQYVDILSLCAIIGKEFDIELLSIAINKPLIELTTLLYEISEKTNIIYDVLEKDNIFAFKSQMLVDAIKEVINYTDKSFLIVKAPQIIRIYNQIIAQAMEKLEYPIIKIAKYYYGAGKGVIKKSFDYQLKASISSKNIFEFENAEKFLENAEILNTIVNNTPKLEYTKMIIEAEKEFIRGEINLDFTNKLIAKINHHSPDELKIITARAAYNAGKVDKDYFLKCYEIAQNYLIPSEENHIKAEGYHFAALSLDNTLENKSKKYHYFTQALKLSKNNNILYSKIATSYAGFLSFENEADKKMIAKDLFLESIKIKESLPIKDLPGLARAYGGLGRLYLFSKPCNCDKAIEYFIKDLQISKELNDTFGISNMYSLLGMAYRLKNDCKKANEYYEKSLKLEHNKIDVFASIFGKIACGSDEIDRAKEYIKKYGIPPKFTYEFLDEKIKNILGLS